MSNIKAAITSIAHWVPERVLDNKELEKMVDTNDEWIVTRTGIKERRILDKEIPTSYMGIKAAELCLKRRGMPAEEIDCIIVASVTPDMWFPSTCCIIQDAIGAKNAWGFDILAACSSFLFALSTGAKMIESGRYKKVMVIGADKMSSITDYTNRNTCILFGDAAGAALLEPAEEGYGILDEILHIDGKGTKHLYMLGGGSLNPPTHETVDKKMHYIYQDGQQVYKDAVKGMADISVEIMKKNNLTSDDITYLVPHQANMRILSSTANRMGISQDKVMINIHKYGNTTAATIPSCISEYWEQGKVKKGDNLILSAFGAGYTWGAIYVKWAY